MQTSSSGRQLIESFEGLYLKTYNDGTGVLTIGYGHTTSAGPPKVIKGQTITEEQADQILSSDLGKVETQVNTLVHVPLNQNQFDALVSFQFNTGALGRSSVLTKLNNKDYQGAADALLLYNRGGGKVMQGLVRRRQSERTLFLTSPSNVSSHTGAAITTVSGSGLAYYFQHDWYWILGGTALAAILVWSLIKYLKKGS